MQYLSKVCLFKPTLKTSGLLDSMSSGRCRGRRSSLTWLICVVATLLETLFMAALLQGVSPLELDTENRCQYGQMKKKKSFELLW